VGHLAAPCADRFEGGCERQAAGGDKGAVLAEAVPHHGVGCDAVAGEQAGEGDVGGQHGGLGDLGLQQLLFEPGDRLGVAVVDEDELGEWLAQQRGHDPVRLGERVCDHRFLLAEHLEHVDVLGALAGVEERDLARAAAAEEHPAGAQGAPHGRVAGLERLGRPAGLVGQLGGVAVVDGDAHRRAQVIGRRLPRLGRVARAGLPRHLVQTAGQGAVVGAAGDERAARRGLAGRRRRRRRRRLRGLDLRGGHVDVGERHAAHAGAAASRRVLLQHGVEVGATEPEGAHAGASDAARGRVPGPQLGVDRERRPAEVDLRVRVLGVDAGRQDLVVERHGRLEQTGGAGGALQVADVRLHRAERDRAGGGAVATERLGQRLDLDHVADGGRGAVTLDERARGTRYPGELPGPLDGEPLPDGVGGGDALAPPVARPGQPEQHRVDAVAVPFGVGQPLEQEQGAALAHDEAVGALRVGPGTGRRQGADLAELHEGRGAHVAVDAASQDGVVLAVDQPLGRRGHGCQAGRAGGVGHIARPAEVEEVRDPAGEDVGELTGHRVLGDGGDRRPQALAGLVEDRLAHVLRQGGERRRPLDLTGELGEADP
jgi:hypothetical protein